MNTRTWERRACLTAAALMVAGASAFAQSARFDVTVAPSAHDGPLTGRLIVAVSKVEKPEPRLMISPRGPAIFGVDLNQLPAGHTAVVDNSASSYPMKLSALPPGDYYVEAVVNVYQQFHRSDGHTFRCTVLCPSMCTFCTSLYKLPPAKLKNSTRPSPMRTQIVWPSLR